MVWESWVSLALVGALTQRNCAAEPVSASTEVARTPGLPGGQCRLGLRSADPGAVRRFPLPGSSGRGRRTPFTESNRQRQKNIVRRQGKGEAALKRLPHPPVRCGLGIQVAAGSFCR